MSLQILIFQFVKFLMSSIMKVILSRKGFDSKYGGCPSPIFQDGTMVFLPIPSATGAVTYSEISANGRNVGSLVNSMTSGVLTDSSKAHFDPDLDSSAMERESGWLPAFGQVGGPLTHLDNQGVGVGDLFLFFGWYRNVEVDLQNTVRIANKSQNLHAIFGYLQVGEILNVGTDTDSIARSKPWLKKHPHVVGSWSKNNRIYVASENLSFSSHDFGQKLPGGGVFGRISKNRILTHPGQPNRSLWRLPEEFSPSHKIATLSCHWNEKRWLQSSIPGSVILQSVAQGQEFVLQVDEDAILSNWLHNVFLGA